jgi:predicted DNA-binding protein (MmcQ/YjbR family)
MTPNEFRELALSFPTAEEAPHFDRAAFKVTGKRIFATMLEKDHTANLKLTAVDQSVFCEYRKGVYPVPNKWGMQGWTTFELKNVPKSMIRDAVLTAYQDVMNSGKVKKK